MASALLFAILLTIVTAYSVVAAAPCYHNTTTCVPVNITHCLTAKVTLTHTSTEFLPDSLSQAEIGVELEIWSLLRAVPECWAVVQPFLCSVYQPKCEEGDQKVERPNRELCERVRGPCEVVKRYNGSWPWFLQCDQDFYAESCGQTFFEQAKFDTEGQCNFPLVPTKDESNWFDEIRGCGMQCENPLYTEGEHEAAHVVVATMCVLCMLATLFTLVVDESKTQVTFMLDWKVGRKYPAVILFFINGCFFLACLGWLIQMFNRQDVVCRKDGTVRQGEPMIGSGESASCTVVFILVYYFMLAGVVWYVMLTYSWDITFKAIGTVRDDLSRKTAYFHITCWCLPLVLTIVVLSISEIDGDSVSGICFPGYQNGWVRTGFVLAPIALVLALGTFFSIRGLNTLIKVRKDTPPFISDKATGKIKETIVRLIVFIILTFVLVFITAAVHLSHFVRNPNWQDSLTDYTYCKANVSVMAMLYDNDTQSSCELDSRPSIVAALLHAFAFFGAGVAMSSWTWTNASLEVWQRMFRRLCNKPENKPAKLRKHRIVASAYKRRKKRNNERLSISYGTDHDDPVGMKFDRSSMSSQSLSSGFAVAMPKYGRHRGRMVRPGTGNIRRHSDSDLGSLHSRHSRRVSSRSSRQDSYESSMSQKLSDIEREIRREERRKRRTKRRKKRPNRIQPILEPISSTLAALQARRLRHMRDRRQISDSSEGSKTSAGGVNLAVAEVNHHTWPIDSSTVVSDSIITGNSISELEVPQNQQQQQQQQFHMPDFSIFTANTMVPVPDHKGENSNGHPNNLKGANPSPSGSFRRGRRREVKLEMTETSFYQEDDENIEMGGNQTIHREENCQESGEIRQNLKELGPLVNEMFERARANSGSGRSSANGRNSNQRDHICSSRLGSASSRGSKGSRGSQTMPKEQFQFANTKVTVPDRPSHDPSPRGRSRRPFSGDYVLVGRRNDVRADSDVRKSRSQPGSATSHKRQIGHNGRLGFEDGLSWSRFLQNKGYTPGQIFTKPQYYQKGQRSRLLPIMDTSHFTHQNQPLDENVNVLNIEAENKQFGCYDNHGANVNDSHLPLGYHGNQIDVLNVEQEQMGSVINHDKTALGGNVNVLNIEEEQRQQLKQTGEGFQYNPNINLSHVNFSDEEKQMIKQKHKSLQKAQSQQKSRSHQKGQSQPNSQSRHTGQKGQSQSKGQNQLNSQSQHSGQNQTKAQSKKPGHVDVLSLDEERRENSNKMLNEGDERRKHSANVLNLDEERRRRANHVQSSDDEHRKRSKDRKDPLKDKTVIGNNAQNVLRLEDAPRTQKEAKRSDSVRQRDIEAVRQRDMEAVRHRGVDPSSKHGRYNRYAQYEGMGPGSASTVSSGYDCRLEESTIVPGNEGNVDLLNLVDYEMDSEYDDFTDDLTDTYTYTSYDDDLTEVSSLPC